MQDKSRIPVIVGVAELSEQVPDDLHGASSLIQLLAAVTRTACEDSGQSEALIAAIDVVAMTRTFADSTPLYPNPFGTVKNPPRALARSIGANPRSAVYEKAGGNTPQKLVGEYAAKLAAGEADVVLLAGGETIATIKAAMRAGVSLDWSDAAEGQLEDRGLGMEGMFDLQQMDNDLMSAPLMYALLENARRAGMGLNREDYAAQIGELFAPFSQVAAEHPTAMFSKTYTAAELSQPSATNPLLAEPYTRAVVAKDGVNQVAAVIMTTAQKALELGISEDRFIYPLSNCNLKEKLVVRRELLGGSVAMQLASHTALARAGVSVDQIAVFDFYSCFPIAVFAACDALGIRGDDERGLTLTGGLPFFGGAGNNYSMHSIVNVVRVLRAGTDDFGLVSANGGFLTKHSVGVYARRQPESGWIDHDDSGLQARLDAAPEPEVDAAANGAATVETYTVQMTKGEPVRGFIIGRTPEGKRFIGSTDPADLQTPHDMMANDPIGRTVYVTSVGPGTRFTFDAGTTLALIPAKRTSLEDKYENCLVKRTGRILEVTINRPAVRNCLTPQANYELEAIFDLYEDDPDLWVAILTGAGDKAFCAGNDLKYTASGQKMWLPNSGFGGLTHRKGRTKPVIAAVNGAALGGGMEIALACDLVVASEQAVFGLPEVNVGLIAGAGGIQRLSRQIPYKKALECILLGKPVTAAEALELGFINRVVTAGDVLNVAYEMATALAAVSPTSVRCSLGLLNETNHIADIVESVRYSSAAIDSLVTSEDMMEGVRAFAEKRAPKWKGR